MKTTFHAVLSASITLCLFLLVGCTKEEFSDVPSESTSSTTQVNNSDPNGNRAATNAQLVAMAANVESITYVSGQYEVEFYGSSTVYKVDIHSFDPEKEINFSIDDGSQTSESIVDVTNGEVDIENEGTYSFRSLDTDSLHASSKYLFKVTMVVIGHHNEYPLTSVSFSDNGNSDAVPPPGAAAICFWCSNTVQHEYFPGLCYDITTTSMVWGLFESESISDTYAC